MKITQVVRDERCMSWEDKLEIKLIKSLNLDDNIVRNLEYIGLKHVSKLIQTH